MGKQIDKIAFIIQGRANSQRCPKKLIRYFRGTTLLDVAIYKILQTDYCDLNNFYLAVGDQELIDIGKNRFCQIYHRSQKSLNSEGENLTEIFEWCNLLSEKYDYVIMLNPCCPFLKVDTINKFVEAYINQEENGLFSVKEYSNFMWNGNGNPLIEQLMQSTRSPNTKYLPKKYEAAHCLYAGSLEDIKNNVWCGTFTKKGDPELFVVDMPEAFDIDYEWQFNMAERAYNVNLW